MSASDLISENLTLKAKLAQVTAKQELVLNTIRIFGFQIQYKRLPSSGAPKKHPPKIPEVLAASYFGGF
jgi:hypothetical protein